jgi:chemotaxis protein histidine kinase CheA
MTEFHLKMEQLRADYRQTVAADLRTLQQQAATLQGDEQDRAALQGMVDVLHRIAGGAGVFGLTKLSEQSHGLELDVNDWLAAPLAASYRAALPEFRAALARLTLD